jgi:GDPmannose 4,6-dehydratase
MFGLAESDRPLTELSRFYPRSPYGAAKLYAHWITVNYREAYGMFASSGILFNHESPRRGETFVTRKIVSAAKRIVSGNQSVLFLGNLDAIRDWGHAKDYVEGMWRILQHSEPDDFVLATGEAITVREFAEKVFEKVGMPISWEGSGIEEVGKNQRGEIVIKIDQKYFRPTEVPFLLGDSSKARRILGWKPIFTVDKLIDDMIQN